MDNQNLYKNSQNFAGSENKENKLIRMSQRVHDKMKKFAHDNGYTIGKAYEMACFSFLSGIKNIDMAQDENIEDIKRTINKQERQTVKSCKKCLGLFSGDGSTCNKCI